MFLFFQNKSIMILYHLSKLKLNVNWSSWMTKATLRVIREAKTFSKKSCFLSFISRTECGCWQAWVDVRGFVCAGKSVKSLFSAI